MRLPILQAILTIGVLLWMPVYAEAGVGITAEKTYKPYEKIILSATELPKGNPRLRWKVEGGEVDTEKVDTRLFMWAKPGRYKVILSVIEFKSEYWEEAETTVIVSGTPDPGPEPEPGEVVVPSVVGKSVADATTAIEKQKLKVRVEGDKSKPIESQAPRAGAKVAEGSTVTVTTAQTPPPQPDQEAPIKAPGFRVLILEESKERPKLPKEQHAILFSKQVRDFLNQNCVKDAENPSGAWRIWDKDSDFSAESKVWQDAVKRDRKSVPWIMVSNGTTGYEGPLPKTVNETLELLKKYLPKSNKK